MYTSAMRRTFIGSSARMSSAIKLLALLQETSSRAKEHALVALTALAKASPANQVAIAEAGGLPSLAGLLDEPKKHRAQKMWLRSKDFSAKRPASEKLYAAFEQRMTVSSQSSAVRTRGAHVQCACSSHAAHTLCT